MEKFEQQFEDLDVKVGIMDQSMGNTVATSTPQDQVDELISKIAEQNNLEITQLPGAANTLPGTKTSNVQLNEMEAKLAALRNP